MNVRILLAAAMLFGACSPDSEDTAPPSIATDNTTAVSTTAPDRGHQPRHQTTLASGLLFSEVRPIRILIGDECRGRGSIMSISLRHIDSGLTARTFNQEYLRPGERVERRIWVRAEEPAGDYRLSVDCFDIDVLHTMLDSTLTKHEP